MNNMCNVDLILKQLDVMQRNVSDYYTETESSSLSRTDYENAIKIEEKLGNIMMFVRGKINENYFFSDKPTAPISENIVDFSLRKTLLGSLKVEKNGEIVCIEMPPLLHKKVYCKSKKNNEYFEKYYTNNLIDNDLYSTLRSFKLEKQIPKYNEKVLVFIKNIVSGDKKITSIPDTDNHEYHDLINTVSSVFLEDDSPEQAAFMCDTEIGNENKTRIYLIPYSKFIASLGNVICLPISQSTNSKSSAESEKGKIIKFPTVA